MDKMKQIESKEDFLKWAHDVNFSHESKRNGIADLQDVFYRAQDGELKQLKTWFIEVNQTEKQLLTFSIIKAMGEETAYKFIKTWARAQAEKVIEEYQKEYTVRENALYERERAITKEKQEYEARIAALETSVNQFKDTINRYEERNTELHKTISNLQNTIYTQNTDLDEAYKALNETTKFKAYLRSVLEDKEEIIKSI